MESHVRSSNWPAPSQMTKTCAWVTFGCDSAVSLQSLVWGFHHPGTTLMPWLWKMACVAVYTWIQKLHCPHIYTATRSFCHRRQKWRCFPDELNLHRVMLTWKYRTANRDVWTSLIWKFVERNIQAGCFSFTFYPAVECSCFSFIQSTVCIHEHRQHFLCHCETTRTILVKPQNVIIVSDLKAKHKQKRREDASWSTQNQNNGSMKILPLYFGLVYDEFPLC